MLKSWKVLKSCNIRNIADWCIKYHLVDRLLVIARTEQDGEIRNQAIVDFIHDSLGAYLLKSFEVSAWPGTELFEHMAIAFIFAVNEELINTLAKVEPNLMAWTHNHPLHLPEDICLFKKGDKLPVLISVTHEGDAWVISNHVVPADIAVEEPEDEFSEVSAYVFHDEYYCRKFREHPAQKNI